MRQTVAIAKKELSSAFGSPLALIFMGTFLLVTFFVFFWVATFFARGIADVRPLFTWMPLLLVFLVAALTMRQWSEEQRSGTLEMLLTLPVDAWRLVLGKFLAVMALVTVALALTVSLPITVAFLGNLDWGPVIGGYVAALLMAAAYTAIGLFVSSRSDNQIVSLIVTMLVGGVLYFIGTNAVLDFVPNGVAAVFRELSTTTHFQSIERGVLDLRDLVFYLSLAGLFLSLNVLSLDSKRWSRTQLTRPYRSARLVGVGLVALNLVLLNGWLLPLSGLRLDMTQNHRYSLSSTTRDLLDSLQQPLLIRAYMSKDTHPLLKPLIPQVADMLHEYQVASHGRVKAQVVDPASNPKIEQTANQDYGIQPHPFQVANRYQSSVVNAYFAILVRYGDQTQVLHLNDLINVTPNPGGGAPNVELNNLEYNLTRAIKKDVAGFSNLDSVLASLKQPAKLTLLATPKSLPSGLQDAPGIVKKVAASIQQGAKGKFSFQQVDPRAANAPFTPQQLRQRYGIQPIPEGLLSSKTYYLQMLLTVDGKSQVVVPSGSFSQKTVKDAVTAALKRSTSGFLKVVGLWTPPAPNGPNAFGQQQQQLYKTQLIQQQLQKDYKVQNVSLSNGTVPNTIDTLVVLSPQGMTDKQRFAIDQFLMRGGSVVVAGGHYALTQQPYSGSLALRKVNNGLSAMLKSYGVTVGDSVVLDSQNAQFPVVVPHNVGGVPVQEVQAVDYPFFVDVQPNAMDHASPITSNLPAVTVPWASPLTVAKGSSKARSVDVLLTSSPDSWTSASTNIIPDFKAYPKHGFPVGKKLQRYPLAVAIRGSITSYFKGKKDPLQSGSGNGSSSSTGSSGSSSSGSGSSGQVGVLTSSPDNARLVVIGSGEIANDTVLNLASRLSQNLAAEDLQLLQNAVDWSTEDASLLSIRASGATTRVLKHLTQAQETDWEIGNYVFALLALVLIAGIWQWRKRNRTSILSTASGSRPERAMGGQS
ncbi:MAG: Gldg family protein [Deinococcales bacterium]